MEHANGAPLNGHPKRPAGAVLDDESDETNENIFLFVPNLIGKLDLRMSDHATH